MPESLHILHGDSAAKIFKKSSLSGDIIVWREMLCEGPLDFVVGSDVFWTKRYAFFDKEFEISKLEYFDETIKEIIQLDEISADSEVVLWFEYHLLSQFNLMAACTYLLNSFRKDVNYYLVCTGKEKGETRLKSLADYPSESYQKLYENRVKISRNDLLFAEKCWQLITENNEENLKAFHFGKNKKFSYLQNAIRQHLQRFPKENGFNQIENKIVQLISTDAFTEKEIVEKMLLWQEAETVYGFSDLQYFAYLKKVKIIYFKDDDILKLRLTIEEK